MTGRRFAFSRGPRYEAAMTKPHRLLLLGAVLAAGTLLACPSYTHMPEAQQRLAREQLAHRSRQLAVSLYTGPFFRDARYRLLSDQPPGDVDLLRNPGGERVLPGEADGILPAGTPVTIAEVEFPTAAVATGRSLLTPRYFTWVYVEVPGREKLQVLVLRDDVQTGAEFEKLLGRYLTTEDVAAKVAALPEPVAKAIAEKRLVEGMDADAARMAWGYPLEVHRRFEDGQRLETWTFEGGRTLETKDGRVVSWSEDGAPSPAAGGADDTGA